MNARSRLRVAVAVSAAQASALRPAGADTVVEIFGGPVDEARVDRCVECAQELRDPPVDVMTTT